MFQLLTPTKAKLREIRFITPPKGQPAGRVGVKMTFAEIALPASALAMLDARLVEYLFRQDDEADQQQLDGMEPRLIPSNIGLQLGWFPWRAEFTGYSFTVLRAVTRIALEDCRINGIRLCAVRESDTFRAAAYVYCDDVSEADRGALSSLKSQEPEILAVPPDVAIDPQMQIDGAEVPARPKARTAHEGTKPADWPFGTNGEPLNEGGDAATDATGAFVEAHAPRRRRGKGEAPAAH